MNLIRHSGISLAGIHRMVCRIPAFAGMTVSMLSFCIVGCEPTYKKETFTQSVQELAKKEYNLDVTTEQVGGTLGARFAIKNLLNELTSGDEEFYRKMNGLFMVLARVGLSADTPPQFIVMDVVDEDNPAFHFLITRYMEDVRKSMAEAISYTQNQDRLVEEFIIGDKRISLDPQEMDLVRLMMLTMDAEEAAPGATAQPFREVKFKDFIARVSENVTRRVFREKKNMKNTVMVREISARFDPTTNENGHFKVLLDLVSQPSSKIAPQFVEGTVLPLVAGEVEKIFKSYRFNNFAGITVIEKNSGKMITVKP